MTINLSEPTIEPVLPTFVQTGDVTTGYETLTRLIVRGLTTQVKHEREGRLYASEAGFCERQGALKATRLDTEVEQAATKTYYAMGITIEELVLDGLYNSKALLFKQYQLPDVGLNMGGFIDGIVHLAGRIRVLEVKSCGELPSKPKGEHAAQAIIYSALTGFPATVLYFSRKVAKFGGELLMAEFNLPEDDATKRAAMYRAAYAHLATLEGVLPPKPSHLGSSGACGYCPFKNVCWEGDVSPWGQEPDAATNTRLVAEANELVDHLMDPAAVAARRMIILKRLSREGNVNSKNLLRGADWKAFT